MPIVYPPDRKKKILATALKLQKVNSDRTLHSLAKEIGVSRNMLFELFEGNNLPYFKKQVANARYYDHTQKVGYVNSAVKLRAKDSSLSVKALAKKLGITAFTLRSFFFATNTPLPGPVQPKDWDRVAKRERDAAKKRKPVDASLARLMIFKPGE